MTEDENIEIDFTPEQLIAAVPLTESTDYEEKQLYDRIVLEYINHIESFPAFIQAINTPLPYRTKLLILLYFNRFSEIFFNQLTVDQLQQLSQIYILNLTKYTTNSSSIKLFQALQAIEPTIKLIASKCRTIKSNPYAEIIFINLKCQNDEDNFHIINSADFFNENYVQTYQTLISHLPPLNSLLTYYIYGHIFELLNNIIETEEQLELFRPAAPHFYKILCQSLHLIANGKELAQNFQKIWSNAGFFYAFFLDSNQQLDQEFNESELFIDLSIENLFKKELIDNFDPQFLTSILAGFLSFAYKFCPQNLKEYYYVTIFRKSISLLAKDIEVNESLDNTAHYTWFVRHIFDISSEEAAQTFFDTFTSDDLTDDEQISLLLYVPTVLNLIQKKEPHILQECCSKFIELIPRFLESNGIYLSILLTAIIRCESIILQIPSDIYAQLSEKLYSMNFQDDDEHDNIIILLEIIILALNYNHSLVDLETSFDFIKQLVSNLQYTSFLITEMLRLFSTLFSAINEQHLEIFQEDGPFISLIHYVLSDYMEDTTILSITFETLVNALIVQPEIIQVIFNQYVEQFSQVLNESIDKEENLVNIGKQMLHPLLLIYKYYGRTVSEHVLLLTQQFFTIITKFSDTDLLLIIQELIHFLNIYVKTHGFDFPPILKDEFQSRNAAMVVRVQFPDVFENIDNDNIKNMMQNIFIGACSHIENPNLLFSSQNLLRIFGEFTKLIIPSTIDCFAPILDENIVKTVSEFKELKNIYFQLLCNLIYNGFSIDPVKMDEIIHFFIADLSCEEFCIHEGYLLELILLCISKQLISDDLINFLINEYLIPENFPDNDYQFYGTIFPIFQVIISKRENLRNICIEKFNEYFQTYFQTKEQTESTSLFFYQTIIYIFPFEPGLYPPENIIDSLKSFDREVSLINPFVLQSLFPFLLSDDNPLKQHPEIYQQIILLITRILTRLAILYQGQLYVQTNDCFSLDDLKYASIMLAELINANPELLNQIGDIISPCIVKTYIQYALQ